MVYNHTASNQSRNSKPGLLDPKVLEICLCISRAHSMISKSRANSFECLLWARHCAKCLQRLSHLISQQPYCGWWYDAQFCRWRSFPGSQREKWQNWDSSPHHLIPETLLPAVMLSLFNQGSSSFQMTQADAHWPFFEGSWKLCLFPWALLGEFNIRHYCFLLSDALAYV